jgi:hypothetical protein
LQTRDLQKLKEFFGMNSQIKLRTKGGDEEDEEDINVVNTSSSLVDYVKKKMQMAIEKAVETATNNAKMKLD